MKTNTTHAIGFTLVIFSLLIVGATMAEVERPEGPKMEQEMTVEMKADITAKLAAKGKTLPTTWDTMTKEEHHAFLVEAGIEMTPPNMTGTKEQSSTTGAGKQEAQQEMTVEMKADITAKLAAKGKTLPTTWDTMTKEEHQAFLVEAGIEMKGGEENHQAGGEDKLLELLEEAGVALPTTWETMTSEERKTFLDNSGIELNPETTGTRQMNQSGDSAIKIEGTTKKDNVKARKAKAFKKYAGEKKARKTFNDNSSIENQDAVGFLQERGIINGYEDGTFKPDAGVSRAEALKMTFEATGTFLSEEVVNTSFADVNKNEWFVAYVSKAKEKGYVSGYKDGTFQPGKIVNKAELLKIAFQVFEIDLSDYIVSTLPSDVSADAWFAVYFSYAIDNNLIDLSDGKALPTENMTRDEFSEVIYRLVSQQETL